MYETRELSQILREYILTPTQKLVLQQMGISGPWIAGGAARRMATGAVLGVADIDVWFKNVAQEINFRNFLQQHKAVMVAETDNNETWDLDGQKVQIIFGKHYNSIQTLHLAGRPLRHGGSHSHLQAPRLQEDGPLQSRRMGRHEGRGYRAR